MKFWDMSSPSGFKLFMLSAESARHDAIVNQQPWPPMSPPSFPLPLSIIINIIFLLLLLTGARSRTVATLFSFGFRVDIPAKNCHMVLLIMPCNRA